MSMFEGIFRRKRRIPEKEVNLFKQNNQNKDFAVLPSAALEAKRLEDLARIKRVGQIMDRVVAALPAYGIDEYNNRMIAYTSAMKYKYPEADRYQILHALNGSGAPDYADITDDFPGGDSVELFAQKLLRKFGK